MDNTKLQELNDALCLGKKRYYEGLDTSKLGNTLRAGSTPCDGLYEAWIQQYQPDVVVEVGSFLGYSAIKMAKEVKRLGMNTKIICVDTWLGGAETYDFIKADAEIDFGHEMNNGYPNLYYKFITNVVLNDVHEIIHPLPFPSSIGSHILNKIFTKVDVWPSLVFLDGSHEENDVMYDCNNYYPMVKNGGAMWGDDWAWDGVKSAAVKFAEQRNINISTNGVMWFVKK
jgi:hypothetical protein